MLFAVLALGFVLKDAQVTVVARLGNEVFVQRFQYGTTWFVGVGAVVEPTIGRGAENLLEVMPHRLFFELDSAEALDAWGVDEESVVGGLVGHAVHLAEGGGVHALVVHIADFSRLGVDVRDKAVQERGFAHTAVARQEGDLAQQMLLEVVHSLPCLGRDEKNVISDGAIEVSQVVGIALFVGIEEVGLVDDDDGRNVVCLGGSEETVDEGSAGLRMLDGDDQNDGIQIGGKDVRLLGEVDGLADDVVAPFLDGVDEGKSLLVDLVVDDVAHRNGVGGADAFQSEITFYLTRDKASYSWLLGGIQL